MESRAKFRLDKPDRAKFRLATPGFEDRLFDDMTAVHAVTEDNGALAVTWVDTLGRTHGLLRAPGTWTEIQTAAWKEEENG